MVGACKTPLFWEASRNLHQKQAQLVERSEPAGRSESAARFLDCETPSVPANLGYIATLQELRWKMRTTLVRPLLGIACPATSELNMNYIDSAAIMQNGPQLGRKIWRSAVFAKRDVFSWAWSLARPSEIPRMAGTGSLAWKSNPFAHGTQTAGAVTTPTARCNVDALASGAIGAGGGR